jgi:hypothetical protein
MRMPSYRSALDGSTRRVQLRAQHNSNLLQVLPAVILALEPRPGRLLYEYFPSFQDLLCVFKWGLLFDERRGWSFCTYLSRAVICAVVISSYCRVLNASSDVSSFSLDRQFLCILWNQNTESVSLPRYCFSCVAYQFL